MIEPKEKYYFDIIITFFTLLLAVFLYAYLLIPEAKILNFSFFIIKVNYQDSFQVLAYLLFTKIHFLLLISLVYVSSSNWWRFFLLPLFFIGYFQVYGILKEESYLAGEEYVVLFLLCVFHCLFLYIADRKISFLKLNLYSIADFNLLKEIINYRTNKIEINNRLDSVSKQFNINTNDDELLNDELRKLESLLYSNKKRNNSSHLQKSNYNYLLSLILLIVPFVIYLSEFIKPNIYILNLGFIKITSHYNDLQFFTWLISGKLALIILLSVWYITTKHIWKYAILIHLVITLYQLLTIISEEKFIDEYELLYALPIITPILILLFFIAKLMKYKSQSEVLDSLISERINTIIDILIENKILKDDLILKFKHLKKNQHNKEKNIYLKELNNIKLELEKKL